MNMELNFTVKSMTPAGSCLALGAVSLVHNPMTAIGGAKEGVGFN